MIIIVAVVALLVTMGLSLIRAMRGPTVYDRRLSANTFNTKTVLMIAALGFVAQEPEDYLDIALVYAIIGFISTVAVLRCSQSGCQDGASRREDTNGEPE